LTTKLKVDFHKPKGAPTVPSSKDSLKERLARYRQIKLSVIGRKSGKTISIPVWFVLEGEKLYLLAVKGSETQWYKNVLKNLWVPEILARQFRKFWHVLKQSARAPLS
jgi:F420H(2)-dependent quinone reductase